MVSMWTLDDPAAAHWSLAYSVSFTEIWLSRSYKLTCLPNIVPKLALVHPLDPNVLYFFSYGRIFSVEVHSRKVLHCEQYNMIFPPEEHHCSRFVYAYECSRGGEDRMLLNDIPISSINRKPLSLLENQNFGIETAGSTSRIHQENLSFLDNFSYGDPGMLSQSCASHDGPTSAVCGKQLLQQESGNGSIDPISNTAKTHQGKLIIPKNFCSDKVLEGSHIHLFKSAQDLRNSIDASNLEFLSKKQAFALLTNANIFQVSAARGITEEAYRADGSCIVADQALLQQIQPADFAYSSRRKQLKEKVASLMISSTIKLCQHTMKGNMWERQRYTIQANDTLGVIQWRSTHKGDNDGHSCRTRSQELAAKGEHADQSLPPDPDVPRRIHGADTAAPNTPGRTNDAEAAPSDAPGHTYGAEADPAVRVSMAEWLSRLQTSQDRLVAIVEQFSARLERDTYMLEQIMLQQAKLEKALQVHTASSNAISERVEQINKQLDQIAPLTTPAAECPPTGELWRAASNLVLKTGMLPTKILPLYLMIPECSV
ncbi:uncharacterized protein LOC123429610 isoform X1 [Hordeum vulgare subsp. vulgare]|uniref:uncharacterized protein LOC123429610 isoform X1 n=1 Tax=Hordeum vulgare subsp. vulgare TaxID=112509 RepID=UPI001D1A4A54|nr:uncharacterized protein LOC123429610 isoform X1 [Hordeum vulgare subsp. vulgare]